VVLVVTLSIFFPSLALDACATTSALVRQRLSNTSANEIALVLATPPPQSIIGSALASQRFAVDQRPGGQRELEGGSGFAVPRTDG